MERELSPREIDIGIKRQIVLYLQTVASFEAQLKYARNVPIADVPSEMINGWSDFVSPEFLERVSRSGDVFSNPELAATRAYQKVWESVFADTPDPLPLLDDLIGTEPWERLRSGAALALTAFRLSS